MSLGGPAALNAAPAQVANGDSEATQSQLERRIISMERAGLDALKAGNLELFGSLTADDAVLIDAHGPANKAQVLKNVQSFKLLDYEMADVRVRAISKTSGLVTYEIKEAGTSHGEDFTARAYISSIWMKRHGKWVCTFSQETAAR
jgi:hypothetical protein